MANFTYHVAKTGDGPEGLAALLNDGVEKGWELVNTHATMVDGRLLYTAIFKIKKPSEAKVVGFF